MPDLKTKFYQMLILGTEGNLYKNLLTQGLGGIIFFTKDIQSNSQFKELIKNIRLKSLISPFLSIDQEGGRVERTENIHHGKKYLSAKFAFEKGHEFLKNQTIQITNELKSYGINLNFAPCIDVNTNPKNPIIGERAFSSEADNVIEGEKIVSNIYKKKGLIPCVKHYPGHGDTNTDSHLSLPFIDLSLDVMEKVHIKPFKYAVLNGIDMVMVGHIHCACFDENPIPASLSKNALKYLINELGFQGVIVSDDMNMKGISNFSDVQACIMGIQAGVNLFIYRNSDTKTISIINEVYKEILNDIKLQEKVENSYNKIIHLKQKYKLF